MLVTGGTGFIGAWCIAELLKRGHVVRTTIRSLAKDPQVRTAVGKEIDPGNRLSVHAAELTADAGWDAAVAGCDYVLHVASPIAIAEPKDPNVLIVPARDGARRVIGAAIKAGVKRVVMTSSVAAASPPALGGDTLTDETQWTDVEAPKVSAYSKSKTLAERAAWELIGSAGGATTLAVVNPALVVAPPLDNDLNGSVQVVERLLTGRMPGLPRLGWNIVDARDVADLHIRAMTAPEAAGERFIAASEWAWMADLARLLNAELGDAAKKVPTRAVPDFVIRFAGLFDKEISGVADGLGRKHDFTSAKAQRLLGWRPRPLKDTILDTARSLLAMGVA